MSVTVTSIRSFRVFIQTKAGARPFSLSGWVTSHAAALFPPILSLVCLPNLGFCISSRIQLPEISNFTIISYPGRHQNVTDWCRILLRKTQIIFKMVLLSEERGHGTKLHPGPALRMMPGFGKPLRMMPDLGQINSLVRKILSLWM